MRTLPIGVAVVGLALGCTGLAGRPSPFAGDAHIELVLEGSGPTASSDAPRLAERFEAVGISATVTPQGDREIELVLDGFGDPKGLDFLLARNAVVLSFPDGSTLTNVDFASAEVQDDPMTGGPIVMSAFTDAGSKRFCELTGTHVEQQLTITIDGATVSQPYIREPICGGHAQLTPGSTSSPAEQELESYALASAMGVPALDSEWSIAVLR